MATINSGTVCQEQQHAYNNCCTVKESSFTVATITVGSQGTITTVETPNPLYSLNSALRWKVDVAGAGTNVYLNVNSMVGPNKYKATITYIEH